MLAAFKICELSILKQPLNSKIKGETLFNIFTPAHGYTPPLPANKHDEMTATRTRHPVGVEILPSNPPTLPPPQKKGNFR